MATTFKYQTGNYTVIMSAELSGLGNGATALSSAINNSPAALGYFYADIELEFTGALNPNSGSGVDLYLYPAMDGTNYADTGIFLVPQSYIGTIIAGSGSAQHVAPLRGVRLPPSPFKIGLRNGLGVALPSGNPTAVTLAILPYTDAGA